MSRFESKSCGQGWKEGNNGERRPYTWLKEYKVNR